MLFIADQDIERLILEDVVEGDLTTRALGLGAQPGTIEFALRSGGRVSGVAAAVKILRKFELDAEVSAADGDDVAAGQVLLKGRGNAAALHQAWKVTQNVLEWCCGVAQTTAAMAQSARRVHPSIQIGCTRKSVPGTRWLAIQAVLDGGAIMHRHGTAESVLLFTNHRRFFSEPFDWKKQIARLRNAAPEKKIIVEVDTVEEVLEAFEARPDVLQMDKFSPESIRQCLDTLRLRRAEAAQRCVFSAAGGIHPGNVEDYAATGVDLIVTSAPYFSKPADVCVTIRPLHKGAE